VENLLEGRIITLETTVADVKVELKSVASKENVVETSLGAINIQATELKTLLKLQCDKMTIVEAELSKLKNAMSTNTGTNPPQCCTELSTVISQIKNEVKETTTKVGTLELTINTANTQLVQLKSSSSADISLMKNQINDLITNRSRVISPNKKYFANMQDDGNFVIYQIGGDNVYIPTFCTLPDCLADKVKNAIPVLKEFGFTIWNGYRIVTMPNIKA
jgi:hypothetical protein